MMRRLLNPAIFLANRLTFGRKFKLIAASYLVVIAILFYALYSTLSQTIHTAQRELDGIALMRPLLAAVQLTQKHRGLEAAMLSGNITLQAAHDASEIEAVRAMQELARALPVELSSGPDWQHILQVWNTISHDSNSWQSRKSFDAHSHAIQQLLAFAGNVSDHYALTLDSEINSYYLLDTAVNTLPAALEQMGQIRAFCLAVLANRRISEEQRIQLSERLGLFRNGLATLGMGFEKTELHNPELKNELLAAATGLNQSSQQIISLIERDMLSRKFATTSQEFFAQTTAMIDAGYQQIFQMLLPSAEAVLKSRMQRAENELLVHIGFIVLVLLVVHYFLLGIYFSMRHNLRLLAESAQNFSDGNLDEHVHVETADEFHQIGDNFNQVADGFKALLARQMENEELLHITVQSALDAFIRMDAQGFIVEWSKQAETIFGWSRDQAVGRALHETIIPLRYREAHENGLKHHLATGEGAVLGKRIEITGLHRDGHEFPIELAVYPVKVAGKISFSAFIRDITERKKAEEALRESEQQAHAFARDLDLQKYALDQHALVFTTDVLGRITYANDLLCKISGYTREELLGQDHSLLNSGYHPRGYFKEMYRIVASGNVWHGEICNRAKDGHRYWVSTTIVPEIGQGGKPQQYIAIRTDITARKNAEEAAYAASRAKSAFLANMSHEIRTPMNGVIGMVDVLRQSELSPEQQRMVRTIQDSSLSLLNILNDILDFSKIEVGKLAVERIPTPLRKVVEDAAQLIFTAANAKSIELSVFVSPQLPHWVASDPTRLRQVLLNLLGNAVKFTSSQDGHTGQVALRAVLCAKPATLADGRPGVQLSVSDNGIGMSPETQEKLFQPFTQADESTSRKFGGTGLGLSITQRLVELMGGQISVRSTLGEGTEFIVEFPLEETAPAQQMAPEPDLTGVHVLAVTGNAVCAEVLTAYCTAAGADVTVVADLAAARAQLQQAQLSPQTQPAPTVLLLDLDASPENESALPDTLRVVQLVLRGRSILAAKAVPVHARPLFYRDLICGLAIASGRMTASDSAALSERRQQSRIHAPTIAEALAAKRLILLAEDNEINREVMREQLRLLGYAAEMAEDGVEALDRWRTGRYALLLSDCHMPNMDGFELTAAIRGEEAPGTHLPIIAVTANALQGETERCIAHGMDDYLSKPLRLDKLGAMLAKWLPLQHAAAETEIAATERGGEPEFSVWDATALTRMVGDNPGMHQRLLKKFLINAQVQLDTILAAAAAGDAVTAGSVAHALKSAARTVGAMQFGELCQEIEMAGKAGDGPACDALTGRLNEAFAAAAEQIQAENRS